MPKGLIIVESPAKANTISKFLDHKYIVKASFGHVRDLPQHDLGVNVDKDFEPSYVTDKKKAKVITELRDAINKTDTIYLASDHDREGEAIAWHLTQLMDKELEGKQIYRIVFNEITAKAIKESLAHPDQIDMAKVNAQQARRVLDRIVGYRVSPLLWKIIAKDLSAGRVQSVALRLICEREQDVVAFVPKEYWKIETEFWKGQLPAFKANLEKWDGKKIELANEQQALEIVGQTKNLDAVLAELKRSTRSMEPPAPFITSTLQQEASKLINFQAAKTMSVAQQLYEGIELGGESAGLITYMRTDSARIADEAIAECRNLVKERFGADMLVTAPRVYKNKSSAQDAHEAIRPTDPFRTPEMVEKWLTKEQFRLYSLIWQRFVATQMKAAKVQQTQAQVQVGKATFVATGNEITEQGFIKAYPFVIVMTGEKIHTDYAKADSLLSKDMVSSQHFTSPPARYTEASLIKELEAKGIGRPSTYAAIITTIRQRKYVAMEKKSFVPTSLGNDVNRFLVDKFNQIFNVKFTAEMEDKLDEIELKDVIWHHLVRGYYDQLQGLIGEVDVKKEKSTFVEDSGIKCTVCNEGSMMIKRNKNGEFLACSLFPKCKNSKPFVRDKDGVIKIKEQENLDEACPQCGNPLTIKNGKYGEFIACTNYPACKFVRNKTMGFACPKCEIGEIVQRKNKKGRFFYSCSTYPKCDWITNDKPIAIACPSCGSKYIFEKYSKERGNYKQCPKCNTEMD
ncbi:MAG: type I DNA topoisomerase [Candidatus Cloacimonetes bacterium HGW-Cloacimonetes-1]|jgi:DNA topoisomerase-1|nr:MAG: type I DNA topoisomerase [Candidatus Cloacimonetes bacterium HGW-Cloacimonetes-1]